MFELVRCTSSSASNLGRSAEEIIVDEQIVILLMQRRMSSMVLSSTLVNLAVLSNVFTFMRVSTIK